MPICRFHHPEKGPRWGWVHGAVVYDLTAVEPERWNALAALLECPRLAEELQRLLPVLTSRPGWPLADLDRPPDPAVPHLLAPLDAQEVWAAGVTYRRSMDARMEESKAEGSAYDRVYSAPRPELFFKATPHRVVGPHAAVRLRQDAGWNVPEPELALVIAPDLRLVGFTVGNDLSSRDIEGENPLYLPQAKVYLECCALGPVIVLAEEVSDPRALPIRLTVHRDGKVAFRGHTSTAQMKRDFEELIGWLGRDNAFPHGVFLLTGTGIVPPVDFTLEEGDLIEIDIAGIGTLRNPVRRGTG
jgi:2-dehydro-3-deoxy-D-arabinonate dehydratase